MFTKEDLRIWFDSLNSVEQLAIASWLIENDDTLLLTFEQFSEKLKSFRRIALLNGVPKSII